MLALCCSIVTISWYYLTFWITTDNAVKVTEKWPLPSASGGPTSEHEHVMLSIGQKIERIHPS